MYVTKINVQYTRPEVRDRVINFVFNKTLRFSVYCNNIKVYSETELTYHIIKDYCKKLSNDIIVNVTNKNIREVCECEENFKCF